MTNQHLDAADIIEQAVEKAERLPANQRTAAVTNELLQFVRDDLTSAPLAKSILSETVIRNACYDYVWSKIRQDRRQRFKNLENALGNSTGSDAKARDRISTHASGMFAMILPNGVTLADATRADLIHAIEHYRKQARTELTRARFFELLAEQIGDSDRKKVKNTIKPDAVSDLYSRAQEEING